MNGAFLLGMTAQRKLDLSAMWELIDYKNIFLLKLIIVIQDIQ